VPAGKSCEVLAVVAAGVQVAIADVERVLGANHEVVPVDG
jgi:hypothetical protein